MSMNDADLRFRASLSDEITPQVDKIVAALKRAGASNAEIKMTLKAIDEATPKIKEARRHLDQMPQHTTININANVDQAQQTIQRFRHEAEKPIDVRFSDNASGAISSFQRVMDKVRGAANTLTLPLANALPPGVGQNLYYGLGAGVLGGIGYGAQKAIRGTIGANSDMEQSMVTLQQSLKDNTRAHQEANKLIGIAQRTPFDFQDVMQADTRLRSYQIPSLPSDVASAHGKDATRGQGWLKIAGDMSASFGLPATTGVEAIADARQGYFRRLESFGIRMQATDFAAGGKSSGLSYEQALAKALKPFAGAQELQSHTLKGLESNLHDVIQNQVTRPIGAVPFALTKGAAENLYNKSNTDQFQQSLGTHVQDVSRGIVSAYDTIKKGKMYFDENIKVPLMDATKAVVTFGSTVAKNFGGTAITVVKTFAETVGLLSNGLKQLVGSGVSEFLVKWISVMKALQFMGFRAADPFLGLAKSINPLNFSLRGLTSNLLAVPGAIAKLGTLILIKQFIDAKQAAQALQNQFKDLSENKFDDLNADIMLMAHGLDQSSENMQKLVTLAAGGIPVGVAGRPEIAVGIAKSAAVMGRDDHLDPKSVVQGIISEMKRTGDYSAASARRFADDVEVAGLAAKEFGTSLTDLQRVMTQYAKPAGAIGLGGYGGAPALLALERGANQLPLTHTQLQNGTYSGDTLLMRMLEAYKAPSIDLLNKLGPKRFDQAYQFTNTNLLPASVSGSVASNFMDRQQTYDANDQGTARGRAQVARLAPSAHLPGVSNPWNEQHMGIDFARIQSTTNPVERANLVFKDLSKNTHVLDSVQGKVAMLTDGLNKLTSTTIAYQQASENLGLQQQQLEHTLVPLQRAIEDQGLAMQKYQMDTIRPLERQMTRLSNSASQVSQSLQNAQYDMGKYSEGLLTGEQAVLDQSHALENYNKQLQLLQLLNQQLGAQLGSTTYERGYSSTVKPMMGLTLAMQIQKSERQQQKQALQYDLNFGEKHYQLQQAQRTARERAEMSFGDRMSGIAKDVPVIDRMTESAHRMGNVQFELQQKMFKLNEHVQDQQDAMTGLQISLQEASTSPAFRKLQDEQYNLSIASTKANMALQLQQQTIDRWNSTVTDLKSQGLDLSNVFKSMLTFDPKTQEDKIAQARKMIEMMRHLPQDLGGISAKQADAFEQQLDKMSQAVAKAHKKHRDEGQNWFDTIKNSFLGLFNEDTWNTIGAQIKKGLDGVIGPSLAGFVGGSVGIAGEATTIAISSGIIGNLVRLVVARQFNSFLARSGLFKGFYEGASRLSQRAMVGVTEAGLPGGEFFARRAVAAQQMADGTRLGGTVGEAVTSPFRVIRRFRQLAFGGVGGAVGTVVGGPIGGLIGGMGGRSLAEETTLRDAGRAVRDSYVQVAKTAETIEEKMAIAADAAKKVAKDVGNVVEPVLKGAGAAALKVPGVQAGVDVVSQTRGIRGLTVAAKAQLLPLDVLKDIEKGKITVEEALAAHGGVPTTSVPPPPSAPPPSAGTRAGSSLSDAMDRVRVKFDSLGHSVNTVYEATERLGPAAKTTANTIEEAAAPITDAAKNVAPAAKAASSGLEEMLKFRKVAGPLGAIFDTVLATGALGHGDIQHQGEGGLIGTGIGALGFLKSKRLGLLGMGLGGLAGSAAGSDDPIQAVLTTAGAIAAQKYILSFGAKMVRGIKGMFTSKVAPVMVEESVAANAAAAEAGVAANAAATQIGLLTKGKAAFTKFFMWEKTASAATGAEAGVANAAAQAEGAAVGAGGAAAGGGLLGKLLSRGKGVAASAEGAAAGGLLSKLKGGAGAGLAIGFGGSLLGDMVGGNTGKQISGAATGAGIGMLLGPEGAVVGGLIGLMLSQPDKVSNAKKALDHFKDSYKDFADTAMRTGDWKGLQQEADRARAIAKVNPDAADALKKTAAALDQAGEAAKRAEMGRRANEFLDAFGEAMKHGAKITPQFVKSMNNSLRHMSPDAQRHAMAAMKAMAKKLHEDGKLPLAQYKLLIGDFKKEGHKLEKDAERNVKGMLTVMTDVITAAMPGFSILGKGLWDLLRPKNKHIDTKTFLKEIEVLSALPHGANASPQENSAYLAFLRNLRSDQQRSFRPPTHTGPLQDPKSPPGPISGGNPAGGGGPGWPGAEVDPTPIHKKVQRLEAEHLNRVKKLRDMFRLNDGKDDNQNNDDRERKTKDHDNNIFDIHDKFGTNVQDLRKNALDKQNKIEDSGFNDIHKTTKGWLGKIIKAVKGVDSSLGLTHGGHASSDTNSGTGSVTSGVTAALAGGGLAKADLHKIGLGRIVRLNEEGHDEMVIPLAPHRRNRAKSLIDQAKGIMGFANGGTSKPQDRLVNPDGTVAKASAFYHKMHGRVPLPTGTITLYTGKTPPFGFNPHVSYGDGSYTTDGAAFQKQHAVWVKYKDTKGGHGGTLAHELGHMFDYYNLNDSARADFAKMMNKKYHEHYSANAWHATSGSHNSGAESFADEYAATAIGTQPMDRYGKAFRKALYKYGFANGGYTYANPMAHAHGIVPERVDMGVDYAFTPGSRLDAIGKARINIAQSSGSGWPGGGYVNYTLLEGPAKGRSIFWAEDLRPTVRAGQIVRAGQQIARYVGGSSGTETGWAAGPINQTLAAALHQQNTGGDPGEFPTAAGASFSHFLESLGAPGGIISGQPRGQMPKSWKQFTDLSVGKGVGSLTKVPKKLQTMGLVGARLYKLLQKKKKFWQNHMDGPDASGGIGDIGHIGNISGQRAWAIKLLDILGDPNTHQNRAALVGWETAEGGHWNNTARFNPLNTTLNAPGARVINSAGVKAYGSWEQGFKATVDTLRNYHGILSALHSGKSAMQVASAIGASPWGTSGGLVTGAIRAMLGHKSLAGGIREVPYDGMSAVLHKGERVLTAGENNYYKSGPQSTGGHVQPHSQGAPWLYKGAEQRVLSALDTLHDIKKDIKRMRDHIKDIDDKTEKKKAEHHLDDLNNKLRQQWAAVRKDTRIADKAIAYKVRHHGDASDGEATSALVIGETSKFHTAVKHAIKQAKHSKPYRRAVRTATRATHAVTNAVHRAHSKHSLGGKKVTHDERKHINDLKHAADTATKHAHHVLDIKKKSGRANYVTGAARRGVNSDLIRQITGKGLDKGEKKLYNTLVKELQKGSKHATKTAAALRKAILGESSKAIKETTKHHKENVKHAQAAKKQRDNAAKETHKVTAVAEKADKKRDKAEKETDKREKEFYKTALNHLEAIAKKDLNVTVHNTATGATLKSTVNNSRKKK